MFLSAHTHALEKQLKSTPIYLLIFNLKDTEIFIFREKT